MFDLPLRLEFFEELKAIAGFEVLHRRVVQQVDIDGVDPEPLEAAFEATADVVWSEIPCPCDHIVAAFGADDDLVAVRALAQEPADDLFAATGPIGIRGVDETHPRVDGSMQRLRALGIVDGTKKPTDGNRAESDHGHFQSCTAEYTCVHRVILPYEKPSCRRLSPRSRYVPAEQCPIRRQDTIAPNDRGRRSRPVVRAAPGQSDPWGNRWGE